MRIEIKHLSYVYNPKSPFETRALNDVSLTIEEGEFFGIIGETGSGKSTFVQHLNALIRLPESKKKKKKRKTKKGLPSKTVFRVGEFDLTEKKTDFFKLRSKVGMVFQYPEAQLFAETVFDDVAFGYKNFAEKKPEREEVETAVRDALAMVGLDYDEIKNVSPFELSGGQKRRVAIAGVIVTRPEVLVLDEPAAGLDPLGKEEIMALLHKIHGQWCKTVIIVSHDMDEVSENCTKIAVFSGGEIKYVLPPAELFEKSEELLSLGLDVPLTAKITMALKAYGVRVKSDFTTKDFVEKVLALGGKQC